jgi:hypothetical protein
VLTVVLALDTVAVPTFVTSARAERSQLRGAPVNSPA